MADPFFGWKYISGAVILPNTQVILCLCLFQQSRHSESASLLPHEYKQLMLLVFKQGARWQQLYSPLDGRSANVTVLALPPLGWLLDVVGFMIKIHLPRFINPEARELHVVGFGNQYCWCDIGINLVMMCD